MNISGIMRTIGFSESDIECILKADEACAVKVREIVNEFYEGKIEYKASVDKVSETCTCGVHEYTVHMLYALCCAEVLYKKYAEKNLPYELFINSMMDLKYKLDECRSVYGICGTMSGKWFGGFFSMIRFAHGRLQYDYKEFEFEEYKSGSFTVKKGDTSHTIVRTSYRNGCFRVS